MLIFACCFIRLMRLLQWLRNCQVSNTNFCCFILDTVSVVWRFAHPRWHGGQITVDSDSPHTVCYWWLIQTFTVPRTISELYESFSAFLSERCSFSPIPVAMGWMSYLSRLLDFGPHSHLASLAHLNTRMIWPLPLGRPGCLCLPYRKWHYQLLPVGWSELEALIKPSSTGYIICDLSCSAVPVVVVVVVVGELVNAANASNGTIIFTTSSLLTQAKQARLRCPQVKVGAGAHFVGFICKVRPKSIMIVCQSLKKRTSPLLFCRSTEQ